MSKIEIFISWSGEKSKKFAEELKALIGTTIQSSQIFLSSDDISAGSRWSTEIADRLEKSGFGIICLTRENIRAPWIMYEAGALSRMVGPKRVSPILIDIDPSNLSQPLSAFQAMRTTKDDIFKLLISINEKQQSDFRIDPANVQRLFDALWPIHESRFAQILESEDFTDAVGTDDELDKTASEKFEELVLSVRKLHSVVLENAPDELAFDNNDLFRKMDQLETNILQEISEIQDQIKKISDLHFSTPSSLEKKSENSDLDDEIPF